MSDLHRLVYTSFRKASCNDDEIANILASCERNNPGRGVTGVLLHSNSRFIQYLEGAKEDVESLYNLIKKDPRHTAINLRSSEAIPERIFPSWKMGYKEFDSKRLKLQTSTTHEEKEKFKQLIDAELDFDNDGLRILQLFFRS